MASKHRLKFAVLFLLLPMPFLHVLHAAERIEKVFSVSRNASLMLTNYTGTVSVKGWQNSEIKVICTKYSQNVEIDTEATASKVKVATHVLDKLAAADKAKVDYQVFVPEEAAVEIVNNMGTVDVENMKGPVKVDVIEAAVRINGALGGVQATSLGSKVVVSQSAGPIQTTTVSGDISFSKLDSNSVTANSTLGNISYEGDFVRLGNYRFSTNEGIILVQCPDQASVEWNARTVKGKIRSNLPIKSKNHAPSSVGIAGKQSLLGTLNQGDATVYLSTFSGEININRR
ncbi:MAG: hypothetical protein L0387_03750 [Acidobacteria bacterium]|nr:hypothetical protein [Acidobacteriota bacterium]MCI0720175.1 hypothetical protein [Acidobacteriota bacterium]